MTVFASNCASLKLAVRRAIEAAPSGQVRVETVKGQTTATVCTPSGRWVPLHPTGDPVSASELLLDRLDTLNPKPTLLIAIGLGLGYLLDALERRQSTLKVLAIEPLPEVTAAMLARRDWTEWLSSGRLALLVGPDYVGASDVWGMFGRGGATPPRIIAPIIEREFPAEATRATTIARDIVAGVKANDEARRRFAGRYLLNTLENLPTITAEGDARALTGAFAGMPAIVVAAGPSLDRNLPHLRALAERALVISVDTAMRPLLAAGIAPHIVAAVDPSDLNARHLRDLPDATRTWFVAEGSIDPSVFSQFAGRTFTFQVSQHQPWPWLTSIGSGRGSLLAWGSVLTTAFDLACRAGCDPIVFAGADLAYSRGLQYCRNTVYEREWHDFPTDEARVELFKEYLKTRPHVTHADVNGHDVITTPHFLQFRSWIVSRAGAAAPTRVMNGTGGGVLAGDAITQVDLSCLTFPVQSRDPKAELAAAWTSSSDADRAVRDRMQQALADVNRLPLAAWLDFAGDTATVAQIAERVTRAARTLEASDMAVLS